LTPRHVDVSDRGGGLPGRTAVLRAGRAAEAPTGREEKKRELGVEKKKRRKTETRLYCIFFYRLS